MTGRSNDGGSGPETNTRDRRLLEALAEGYQPPPLTSERRAAIRRGVDDRLAWRRRRPLWVAPALATAAVATAAAWLVFIAPSPAPSPVDDATDAAWEERLLLADSFAELSPNGEDEFLPDEYEAIAAYFLEL